MKSFASRIRIAGLGLALVSTMGFASVTLNDDGTGWVGKGDVQLAFGWNNAAAQRNVNAVSFSFEQTSTYSAVCEWTTGEGTKGEKTHDVTHKRKVAIASSVDYRARMTGQWTGYFLLGFGDMTEEGEMPVVGGACPGNGGHEGVWTSVTETSSSPGELFVTFQGNSVALPETPPPEAI